MNTQPMNNSNERKMQNILQRGLILVFCAIAFSCTSKKPQLEKILVKPNQVVSTQQLSFLLTTDQAGNCIWGIDKNSGKSTFKIDLPAIPQGLVIDQTGTKAYVTTGDYNGKLLEIDVPNRKITREIKLGHTPVSPCLDGKGNLYLANRFNNELVKINLSNWNIVASTSTGREPIAVEFDTKNQQIIVGQLLPDGALNQKHYASSVSIFDNELKLKTDLLLPDGSNAVKDICTSPDGKYAYATHVLARYWLPTNQIDRGWINTNAISIIDLKKQTLLNTVLLDELDKGTALPWGINCTPDGKHLTITANGTHELILIDRTQLHQRLTDVSNGKAGTYYAKSSKEVPNDLSFLQGIRKRIALNGLSPKSCWTDATHSYTAMYFSGNIIKTSIDQAKQTRLNWHQQPVLSEIDKGELYFSDASICKQNWQACASCHPGEARVDGLNWDNLNDGIGNPKNTKSLLLAHQTPPSMATGIRANAEAGVRAGIDHILFTQLPDSIANALDSYLISLKPAKSPYLENGKLSAKAQKGKVIFEQLRCAHCHSSDLYTDLKQHNIGTGEGREKNTKFDTPTLIETWRTAPYLHHGKAATIKEVFTKFNTKDLHGKTKSLSAQQIDQLTEYILSL
ncbi:c-type cytochrome [Prolixibacteraceae bacterium JC049]|nr:c-type cytochrome [Prolixibacteraceae bacterium JC049]